MTVIMLFVAIVMSPARADDDFAVVDEYLADLGMTELRAEYMERQLDSLDSAGRIDVAERLAELYARLLRNASDNEERERLEERATELLDAIPQVESDELRLSLAKASFERAESVLERWRVRATTEDEARGAIDRMRELAPIFERVGRQSHDRIERLESREERARDADLPLIESRIDEATQSRSTAFYLAGWSHRYVAEFNDDRSAPRSARIAFGWLLNASTGDEPDLDRIPEGYERLPHVALAMLSVAYTHALEGNMILFERWFDRVESAQNLADSVRAQLETRRIVGQCAAGRWSSAERTLDRMPASEPTRVLASRLGAVLASNHLVTNQANTDAARLRDAALASLVAQGELGQAVDVVEVFGLTSLPESGFVGGLVRAVVEYQRLRTEHRAAGNGNKPAKVPELIAKYRRIATSLDRAIKEPDALEYESAQAGAVFVLGMARYYAADFQDAIEQFSRAAELGEDTPTEPDALWMAILSIDAAGASEDERYTLTDRFLAKFPDHPNASRLTIRRALERKDDPERSIELLLAIRPTEASYDTARRHAATLTYQQAVRAKGPQRAAHARRFLNIAEPLLAHDRRLAEEDPEAAKRAVSTARRILSIALRADPPEVGRAMRAFDALDSMTTRGLVSVEEFEGELLFRRAEHALAIDDVENAEQHLETLQIVDPALAAQGDRLIWRHALRRWRRDATGKGGANASRVVRVGTRLIDEMGDPDIALTDDANASVYRSCAQAARGLWKSQQDESARDLARRLFGDLMAHGAESRDTIEGFVEMAQAGGDIEGALEAQRRLVAGLETGSRAWFEARTLQFELLTSVDTSRAREALRQHIALYPDLGPESVRDRLRDLAQRLNVTIEATR